MPHKGRAFSQAKSVLSPARKAALDIVSAVRVRDAFTHELVDVRLGVARLCDEDRAFATLLALGVATARGTLDEIIERTLDKPTDIQPEVRDCLRISTYEIIFLGKSPHAAVDQGVELVRSVVPQAAGLANFILRRVVKMREQFPFGDPRVDDEALARLFAFPLWLAQLLIEELGRDEAARFMRISNEQAPVYLAVNAIRTSHPEKSPIPPMENQRDKGNQRGGSCQGRGSLRPPQPCHPLADDVSGVADQCLEASPIPPMESQREASMWPEQSQRGGSCQGRGSSRPPQPCHPLVDDVSGNCQAGDGLQDLLAKQGAQQTDVPGCFLLADSRALANPRIARALDDGRLLVSDMAAQRIAQLVSGPQVLEVGAGRGTKTILIQSNAMRVTGEQFELTALDNRGFKADLLRTRAATYGVELKEALVGDACNLDKLVPGRMFDTVFIDAPCSGLGTLRRHPEIRWRLQPQTIERLGETQGAMLRSAATHVKPGGRIVFSTCTVTSLENVRNIKAFLSSKEGEAFRIQPIDGHAAYAPSLESGGSDAHFAVVLRNCRE